jgi:hypothetical protein
MRLGVLVMSVLTVALVGAAAGRPTRLVPPCRASQVQGRFALIPGSAGAGNVVYKLGLHNRSSSTCFVSGLPRVRLYGVRGQPLPTHVIPALPGAGTAVLVALRPGARAKATARFSPDVPGPGEPLSTASCEPRSTHLRVTLGGGSSLLVPVAPPTPVCEHGSLQLSVYQRA